MSAPWLRIGTRAQAGAGPDRSGEPGARRRASGARRAGRAQESSTIRTTGDQITDRPLAELGGKGLFCKELEAALLERRIDLAVHSIKDLPTWLPAGLVLGAVLEREDPRDVLLARAPRHRRPAEAAVIGTSVRRKAQLLAKRGDLRVIDFRGNVDTRLRKLAAGEVDATLLALAGLRRLGIDHAAVVLLWRRCCPRSGRARSASSVAPMTRRASPCSPRSITPPAACVRAERALLAALDGSCHTPIAGYAEMSDEGLHLRALIARPDGSACLRTRRTGAPRDAEALGRDAGEELRSAPARASSTERGGRCGS